MYRGQVPARTLISDEDLRKRFLDSIETVPYPVAAAPEFVRRARRLRRRQLVVACAVGLLLVAGVVVPLALLLGTGRAASPTAGGLAVVQLRVNWTGGPGGLEGSETSIALRQQADNKTVW